MLFGMDPEWEKNRRKNIELANQAVKGVGIEQLVPGAIVTISSNKATGDRSYTRHLLEVRGIAGNSVSVLVYGDCADYMKGQIILQFHEHEFYLADHLVESVDGN